MDSSCLALSIELHVKTQETYVQSSHWPASLSKAWDQCRCTQFWFGSPWRMRKRCRLCACRCTLFRRLGQNKGVLMIDDTCTHKQSILSGLASLHWPAIKVPIGSGDGTHSNHHALTKNNGTTAIERTKAIMSHASILCPLFVPETVRQCSTPYKDEQPASIMKLQLAFLLRLPSTMLCQAKDNRIKWAGLQTSHAEG